MKVWPMRKIKVAGYKPQDKRRAVQILRSMGFTILPTGKADRIVAQPAGARRGEVNDLRDQLKGLNRRIKVDELEEEGLP